MIIYYLSQGKFKGNSFIIYLICWVEISLTPFCYDNDLFCGIDVFGERERNHDLIGVRIKFSLPSIFKNDDLDKMGGSGLINLERKKVMLSCRRLVDLLGKWHTPKLLDGLVASPKMKITKEEGIGARPLVHSTSRLEGHAKALGWGLRRLTSNSITHTD